jgi:hypothetical protein
MSQKRAETADYHAGDVKLPGTFAGKRDVRTSFRVPGVRAAAGIFV